MIEAERVTDFLASHGLPPSGRVVGRGVEVGVVELHGSLRDVAPRRPDRGEPEPPVPSVAGVADLHATACRPALPPGRKSGRDRRVKDVRLGPVGRGRAERGVPSGCRQVVAQVDRERVRLASPVIAAPGVVRGRGSGAHRHDQPGGNRQLQSNPPPSLHARSSLPLATKFCVPVERQSLVTSNPGPSLPRQRGESGQ